MFNTAYCERLEEDINNWLEKNMFVISKITNVQATFQTGCHYLIIFYELKD